MRHLIIAALASGVFISCASAPPPRRTPTVESPDIGCILPTLAQRGKVPGTLLPEIVRVIGITPIEDGERLKVLRAGEFNPSNWQPWPKELIHFGAICGREADAFRELDAVRGAFDDPRPNPHSDNPPLRR